jgi:hypothetical protein
MGNAIRNVQVTHVWQNRCAALGISRHRGPRTETGGGPRALAARCGDVVPLYVESQLQEGTARMRERTAADALGVPSGAASTRETLLVGWRLIVARVAAYSVVAVTVILGIVALINWRRLAIPCADALNSCLLTPEQVAPLARIGITPTGLALGVVVLCCAAIGLANGVAALLFWRRSNDAMGLLVAVTLVLLPAFFTPMYQALTGEWHAAAEIINRLGGLSFLLLLGLFPSGHFAPRWIWAPLLVFALFGSGIGAGYLPTAVVLPIIIAGVVSLIGGQVYRYRRLSTPIQRQQTKWAVTGIVLALLINQLFWQPEGWIPALQRKDSLYPLLLYPDFVLLISVLAICFGVAILRYRLYDIDLIIRRTLVYGTLTAMLAGVYAIIVFVGQLVGERLTGQSAPPPWLIVVTTLFIAALFNPLRGRVQALIDRRFYRSKYDAARTIEAFGATLRSEVDIEGLRAQLIEVVQTTMQPTRIGLWLRPLQPQGSSPSLRQDFPPR